MSNALKEHIKEILLDITLSDSNKLIAISECINAQQFHQQDRTLSFEDLILDQINQMSTSKMANHIKTGFKSYDDEFGGLELKEYVLLASPQSVGKTQLLINLALNISTSVPILFITCSESTDNLARRFIGTVSQVSLHKVLNNTLCDFELEYIQGIKPQMAKHQIYINEGCFTSFDELNALIEKYVKEFGIKIVMIDAIDRIPKNALTDKISDLNQLNHAFQMMSREYGLSIISSMRVSVLKDNEPLARSPEMNDLEQIGISESFLDKIIFMYRPEFYDPSIPEEEFGLTQIILAKNRSGKTGDILVKADFEYSGFRDIQNDRSVFKLQDLK